MARQHNVPRPGSKLEYVWKHIDVPTAELIERAKADGFTFTTSQVDQSRYHARKHYGNASPKAKAKAIPKHTPKARAKAKAAKHANGVSPARTHKQAQLRKLIFEMGFDDVRSIYLEFQEMHNRFNQE